MQFDLLPQRCRIDVVRDDDIRADDFSSQNVTLAVHNSIANFGHLQNCGFDLGRINLLSSHIDQIGVAAEDPEIFAILFNSVASDEVSILGERTWSVQISEHGRIGLDLQNAGHHAKLIAFAAEFHPKRVRTTSTSHA